MHEIIYFMIHSTNITNIISLIFWTMSFIIFSLFIYLLFMYWFWCWFYYWTCGLVSVLFRASNILSLLLYVVTHVLNIVLFNICQIAVDLRQFHIHQNTSIFMMVPVLNIITHPRIDHRSYPGRGYC